ncbi:MAG: two-component system chemotaxis response regulator CheY [Candidatus Endobugula sp.]|jgi:two-component system chemotaxis response regulator CheY
MKLMIVDDSNIIRSRIERAYKKNKSIEIVATARNGRDALEKANHLKPDLITMDLTMPGMDGLQCIKHINKMDSEIKILVVSALSDVTTGLEAIESGARGFLCKPFTDEELIAAIDQIITADAY